MVRKSVIAIVAALFAAPALANEVPTRVQVFHHTTTVASSVPINEMICQNVEVPVYATRQSNGATGGDVLTGMIIGGLLGKGLSGDDGGAAAGAVMGGVIAADKGNNRTEQVITGYRTERQCNEVVNYRAVNEEVYSHSTIRFYIGNKRYVVEFQR